MSHKRVALVTGGAGGIGRAICHSLAEAGHRVAAADLVVTGAEKVATEVGGLGVELDVTDVGSLERTVQQVATELGPVDILVNCVGWERFKTFLETDEAFTAKVLEINLTGPGLPEDIAPAVRFLASEEAAFITGQTLSVSGGMTMC